MSREAVFTMVGIKKAPGRNSVRPGARLSMRWVLPVLFHFATACLCEGYAHEADTTYNGIWFS